MIRTSGFDVGEGPSSVPTCQWDSKRKLFNLEVVCTGTSAVLVFNTNAWPYVLGRRCKKKKLSNRVPETYIYPLKRHILRYPASIVTSYQMKKKNCDFNCYIIAPCPVIGLVNKWP